MGFQVQKRQRKQRTLDAGARAAIIKRINRGDTYRKIAQDFGISATHVGRVYQKFLEEQRHG